MVLKDKCLLVCVQEMRCGNLKIIHGLGQKMDLSFVICENNFTEPQICS